MNSSNIKNPFLLSSCLSSPFLLSLNIIFFRIWIWWLNLHRVCGGEICLTRQRSSQLKHPLVKKLPMHRLTLSTELGHLMKLCNQCKGLKADGSLWSLLQVTNFIQDRLLIVAHIYINTWSPRMLGFKKPKNWDSVVNIHFVCPFINYNDLRVYIVWTKNIWSSCLYFRS